MFRPFDLKLRSDRRLFEPLSPSPSRKRRLSSPLLRRQPLFENRKKYLLNRQRRGRTCSRSPVGVGMSGNESALRWSSILLLRRRNDPNRTTMLLLKSSLLPKLPRQSLVHHPLALNVHAQSSPPSAKLLQKLRRSLFPKKLVILLLEACSELIRVRPCSDPLSRRLQRNVLPLRLLVAHKPQIHCRCIFRIFLLHRGLHSSHHSSRRGVGSQ